MAPVQVIAGHGRRRPPAGHGRSIRARVLDDSSGRPGRSAAAGRFHQMSNQSAAAVPLVDARDMHASEVARGERFEFGGELGEFPLGARRGANRCGRARTAAHAGDGTARRPAISGHWIGQRVVQPRGETTRRACALLRLRSAVGRLHHRAATSILRQRADWIVERGSALDADYLRRLGPFDIVYSWGVLHHTGKMWQALENAAIPVSSRRQTLCRHLQRHWVAEPSLALDQADV